MQARAAEDLRKLVTDRLVAAGLVYEGAKAFATPRRLALAVQGVPVRQPDVREEKKGPRVGAPEGAIQGFLRAAGPQVDRRGQGAARQEGRLLRRGDREAGPARDRGDRRDRARGGEDLPLAEIDALGRAIRQAGRARLGAAAAFHRRDLRAGDRGARHRQVRGRRHRRRRRDPRPPFHGAAAVQGAPPRRTTRPSSRRPRSCSIPSGARR